MQYIGITGSSLKKRLSRHFDSVRKLNSPLCLLMKKYKKEDFIIETIEEAKAKYLPQLEIKWIKHFNSIIPNGLNSNSGGAFRIKSINGNKNKNRILKS